MSNVSLLSDHKFNAFAWFIAEGTVVDGVTVAVDAKPDITPTSNWPWLGCVLSLTPFVNTEEDETIHCPNFNGGYDEVTDAEVIGGGYRTTLRKTNGLLRQLEHGLDGLLDLNAAQEPFKPGSKPYIQGWLKLTRKDSAGNEIDVVDLWCRLSMTGEIETTRGVSRPEVQFLRQPSAFNTIVAKA